jgi:hypothetical protein
MSQTLARYWGARGAPCDVGHEGSLRWQTDGAGVGPSWRECLHSVTSSDVLRCCGIVTIRGLGPTHAAESVGSAFKGILQNSHALQLVAGLRLASAVRIISEVGILQK